MQPPGSATAVGASNVRVLLLERTCAFASRSMSGMCTKLHALCIKMNVPAIWGVYRSSVKRQYSAPQEMLHLFAVQRSPRILDIIAAQR